MRNSPIQVHQVQTNILKIYDFRFLEFMKLIFLAFSHIYGLYKIFLDLFPKIGPSPESGKK